MMKDIEYVIRKVCYEANRAYCEAIGDKSQPPWEDATPWQLDSAVSGVQFHLANPGASPDAAHNEWLRHKAADGWMYGPVKDPDKKEHPCFVPFEQLPAEQQAKDKLFSAIVNALRPT